MYRFRPDLTIDLSSEKRPVVNGGQKQPSAPYYLTDDWWRLNKDRPWFHLRYHSTSTMRARDFPPHHLSPSDEGPRYLTLHMMVVHSLDETGPENTTYLHPHETYEIERRPKVFALCLEVSDSRDHPQRVCSLFETDYVLRKINKRVRASDVTRQDFVTDEPLDAFVRGDLLSVELPDLLWREVEVLETRKEASMRTWYEKRARDAAGAAR